MNHFQKYVIVHTLVALSVVLLVARLVNALLGGQDASPPPGNIAAASGGLAKELKRPEDVAANARINPVISATDPRMEAVSSTSLLESGRLEEWRGLGVGQIMTIPLTADKQLPAIVERAWSSGDDFTITAFFQTGGEGTVWMKWTSRGFLGMAQFPEQNLAYVMERSADGNVTITEKLLSHVLCVHPTLSSRMAEQKVPVSGGMPRPTNQTTAAKSAILPGITSVPVLRGRPSSTSVVYLDFDGETIQDGAWAGGAQIVAPAARLSDSQILEVWRRVVQDFEVFDVNVTTLYSDYTSATPGRRTHVIITQNDAAAPGAGGVAYIGSFAGLYSLYCWAFIDDDAKSCAEVISHEVGHTLGLYHDGRTSPPEEYYAGHGDGITGWAPIMGVGYYKELVQWSRGQYANANNSEDDLAIMSGLIAYIADDHGNSTGTASAVVGATASGRLSQSNEVDVFSVSLTGGTHTIYMQPEIFGNVDSLLEVLSNNGTLIATSNPPDLLTAAVTFNLASSQTVYLLVKATGKGAVLGTGYSSYSSIGPYTLSGFGDQQQPPSPPVGLSLRRISGSQLQLSWQLGVGAISYDVYRDAVFVLSTTNTAIIDTGLIPATLYTYTLRATNAYGISGFSEPASITTLNANQFAMDGEADFAGYLVSSPGMVIHAAVRGTRLYVSTWSPGSNGSGFGSDHHLFVSDELLPAATTPAPWAKAGFIAIPGDAPYLAGESLTTYAGWFNTTGSVTLFKPPVNSLQMEGSLDLVEEFGFMPEYVYLAAIAYNTDDGGGVAAQAPAATVVNNNLEPAEFLAVPTANIADAAMDGIYDILSPERSFMVTLQPTNDQSRAGLEWRAVPGKTYQIYRQSNLMENVWQWLGVRTAGITQWNMTFLDTNSAPISAFYHLRFP